MNISKIDEYMRLMNKLDEKRQDKDSDFDMFYFLTMGAYEDNPYNKYNDAYISYREIITTLEPFMREELERDPEAYGFKADENYSDFSKIWFLIDEALSLYLDDIKSSTFYKLLQTANKRYEESLQKIEVEPLKEVQLPLDMANRQIFNYLAPGEYYLKVDNNDLSKYIYYKIKAIDEEKAKKYDYSTPFDELIGLYVNAATREGTHYFDATQIYKYYKGAGARPDQATIDKIDAFFEKYSNIGGVIDGTKAMKDGRKVRYEFPVFLNAVKKEEYFVKNHKVVKCQWYVEGPSIAAVFAERTGLRTTRDKNFIKPPEKLSLSDDNILLWFYISRWLIDYKDIKRIENFHVNSAINHLIEAYNNKVDNDRTEGIKSLPEDISDDERTKAIADFRSNAETAKKNKLYNLKKKLIKKDPEKKTDIDIILQDYVDKGYLKSFEYDDKNKKDVVYKIKWEK